jgi:hypothetical protein
LRSRINLAAAQAFHRVMALLPLIGGLLGSTLLVTGVLRTLAIARRIDELTSRQWYRLAQMHSDSGVAFFATREARVQLEAAMADAVHLACPHSSTRRARSASLAA